MRDLNFFSTYIKEKQLSRKKTSIILTAVMIAVIAIGGAYGVTGIISLRYKADTASMKKYLISEEVLKNKLIVERKKQQIALLNNYIALVDKVSSDLEKTNIIGSKLIEDLNSTLPATVVFKSISITGNQISITGIAQDRIDAAELYHNFVGLGIFESVDLGTLQKASQTAPGFTFDLKCTLKDVVIK